MPELPEAEAALIPGMEMVVPARKKTLPLAAPDPVALVFMLVEGIVMLVPAVMTKLPEPSIEFMAGPLSRFIAPAADSNVTEPLVPAIDTLVAMKLPPVTEMPSGACTNTFPPFALLLP